MPQDLLIAATHILSLSPSLIQRVISGAFLKIRPFPTRQRPFKQHFKKIRFKKLKIISLVLFPKVLWSSTKKGEPRRKKGGVIDMSGI